MHPICIDGAIMTQDYDMITSHRPNKMNIVFKKNSDLLGVMVEKI